MWRIQLLGGHSLKSPDRTVTRFRTQKAAELFAYLAYHSGTHSPAHARETLIGMLWPDTEPTTARHYLSVELTSLRHMLEPPGIPPGTVLVTDRFSVRLHSATVSCDVALFEESVRKSVQPHLTEEKQLSFLLEAAQWYQGPLLPGLYTEWIGPEATRLNSLFLQVVIQAVPHLLQRGDADAALAMAQRAVAADPLSEAATQSVMQVFMALGQPSQALRQYRELERRLQKEWDEKPSPALQAWADQIRRSDKKAKTPEVQRAEIPESAAAPSPALSQPALPSGTVTFLLTDIEGSTALWERAGEAFREALEAHHALLRQAFVQHDGQEIKETGDGFLAVFARAGDALACALATQRALTEQTWPKGIEPLAVRMALHTSSVEAKEGDYHDLSLHRASRILSATHGRQILCSETTAALLGEGKSPGVQLLDMGKYRLRGIENAVRLFQVTYPGMTPQQFPRPLAEPEATSTLLPRLTRFFGREAEISRLEAMLSSPGASLVTIIGAGGMGKTRLAVEMAAHLMEKPLAMQKEQVWSPKRVCFVPLADIKEAERIPDALLRALGGQPSSDGDLFEQVAKALSEESGLLLVLDNFEQLAESGAFLVRDLARRAPQTKFLVTSRQNLRIEGEQEFHLAPLPTTGGAKTPQALLENVSAVLFVDRAQAVRPDFQVTEHNAETIGTLCDRLEGIPLAIELAAARTQLLSPAHILEQITANRLDFLTTRKRDANSRHRTLRATLNWSFELLTPATQALLTQLSVFRGGWTLEAAETVCRLEADEELLELLGLLRDNSLLHVSDTEEGLRFTLLETIREYAAEHLERSEGSQSACERHRDFFLAFVLEAEQNLHGPEQALWYSRLERELDNVRAALAWCQQDAGGAEAGLTMVGRLWKFWRGRGYAQEGRQVVEAALARQGAEARTTARALALNAAGVLTWSQGDLKAARRHYEESLSIRQELGEKQGVAGSLHNLGSVAQTQGDCVAAHSYFTQALAINSEIGNRSGEGHALTGLATIAQDQSEYAAARSYFEQSLAVHRELGDPSWQLQDLTGLGELALIRDDGPTARLHFEEALALCHEIGDRVSEAVCLAHLGELATLQGDYESAHACYDQSLGISRETAYRVLEAETLTRLAELALTETRFQAAQTLSQQALTLCREDTNRPFEARNLRVLANLAINAKDYAQASRLLEEGMRLAQIIQQQREYIEMLEAFAALSIGRQEYIRAARFYAAEAHRKRLDCPLAAAYQPDYTRRLTVLREGLTEAALASAWEEGAVLSLEQAADYALHKTEPLDGA